MADLWIIGNETKWSFARRQSTEPFYPIFSSGYLLLPFLSFGDNFTRGFISSNNCQK